MKKNILLTCIVCFNLMLISGCSSNAPKDSPAADNPKSSVLAEDPEDTASADIENDSKGGLSHPSDSNTSPDTDSSADPSEIRTAEGYVMAVDGDIMYVDLENTGGRNYPGEGEDRKVAFNIADAKQIQTDTSVFSPSRDNLVRTGINVKIKYYIKNGVNIATELTSDGDELEPVTYVSIGHPSYISDSKITLFITDGENSGKTIDYNLSECDSSTETISLNDLVVVTYYCRQGIYFATSFSIAS